MFAEQENLYHATSPNKSKMTVGGHIEFCEMPVFPYILDEHIAHNLVETCNATTRKYARDQKRNQELIRTASSVGNTREQLLFSATVRDI